MAVLKDFQAKIIPTMLDIFQKEGVLPNLFLRTAQDTFNGSPYTPGLGQIVEMRLPGGGLKAVARKYEFRTRSNPIPIDDIAGGGYSTIPIKLDTHITSKTDITAEAYTLDELSYTADIARPQAEAVADKIETEVKAGLDAIVFKETLDVDADDRPLDVVLEMDRRLTNMQTAPRNGRFIMAGANVVAQWTSSNQISRFDSTGQPGTPALRNGALGTIAGRQIVTSDYLDPNYLAMMHPSLMVLGQVAPALPYGAPLKQRLSRDGYGMSWIVMFDDEYAMDMSLVHSFMGITPVYDARDAQGNVLDDAATVGSTRGIKANFSGFSSVIRAHTEG